MALTPCVAEAATPGTALSSSLSDVKQRNYAQQTQHNFGDVRVYTEGVDFSRPVGAVIRLHGDGAYEYHNPGYLLEGLAAVAAAENKILIAPLTPDSATTTWWKNSASNADWLAELLEQQILPEYGIDRSDIWWMGYSGGAELLAHELILSEPQLVSGGALMLGGGGRPWGADPAAIAAAAEQVGPLTWVSGTADDGTDPQAPFNAYGAAQEGAAWYRAQGFGAVEESYPQGVDHFGLNSTAILQAALD
ncbi:hypothetical protein COCCU_10355 [Corynebacterium occultum]|uniref:Alpha/beta hydrolase family protein n=1 Tax=Corynebacterium occultum TaxID=2675219 RepID=A0A6B8WDC1_9CORY|nr:hypothetical protein COCCU_10355 [Corynebacterium occultum]